MCKFKATVATTGILLVVHSIAVPREMQFSLLFKGRAGCVQLLCPAFLNAWYAI